MSEIDFASFYSAVHSSEGKPRTPFPWQAQLAEHVLSEGWPETIAVPTGCGKTSVVDVAVYALAAQAGRSALERTAPLRIFFVVDRRLVVDDVFIHARNLASAIDRKDELAWVRSQLMRFGGRQPLDTAVLRGGMYRSDVWADVPNQPLVCVSTVDQVGSRLLFRGYGLTEARRPIDAGLVGCDSLFIVDEAHLSKPFLDTLEWVRRYQAGQTVAQGLQCVKMSATPGEDDTFALTDQDWAPDQLGPRLKAEKRAELKECANVAEAAAEEAAGLDGVVGVVLNTVASARTAFERLKSRGEATDCWKLGWTVSRQAGTKQATDCSWLLPKPLKWEPTLTSIRWLPKSQRLTLYDSASAV